MPLTDPAIRNAKPKAKPYKLADEKGMYLLVNKSGRYFRFDYRFAGKQKTLALGVYPEVSLKNAREELADARRMIREGIDPSHHKKLIKSLQKEMGVNTFEAVAREWFTK